jgi:hypothetical protein
LRRLHRFLDAFNICTDGDELLLELFVVAAKDRSRVLAGMIRASEAAVAATSIPTSSALARAVPPSRKSGPDDRRKIAFVAGLRHAEIALPPDFRRRLSAPQMTHAQPIAIGGVC